MMLGRLTLFPTKLICDRLIGTDQVLTDQDFPEDTSPHPDSPVLALVADEEPY